MSDLITSIKAELAQIHNNESWFLLYKKYLDKKSGLVNELLKIQAVNSQSAQETSSPELLQQQKEHNQALQTTRNCIQQLFATKKKELEEEAYARELSLEGLHLSLLTPQSERAFAHPVIKVIEEMKSILTTLGFAEFKAPEVESDWYNFTALNIDLNHPARTMHDTFYLNNGRMLRTHTSNGQIHALLQLPPPFATFNIGKVYRVDYDQTHLPMFHQVEAFVVQEAGSLNVGHLKWLVLEFLGRFFGHKNLKLRFRPSYFPFTSPSFEIDIAYKLVEEKVIFISEDEFEATVGDIAKTKRPEVKWLEVMGCGITHPEVFRHTQGKGIRAREAGGVASQKVASQEVASYKGVVSSETVTSNKAALDGKLDQELDRELDRELGSGVLDLVPPELIAPELIGIAFGAGVERLCMLKYGFSDLREFINSNLSWLAYTTQNMQD